MEIRVLGPVEVVVEGQVRPLPGGGERELLALLALSAGRVVAVPALVDGLWGEDLPAHPGNALQVRVSKLRRALGATGAPSTPVLTRPPGYLLDVDPQQVDALRFPDRVAAARAVADSDPVAAAVLYREALSCWRGAALAEFTDSRWAGPEATRLTELQLSAREELIDLELAAGRHTEVLAELEALTTAHPLRERLHSRLMLALYRAGRQADALTAYQRARAVLDAELGLAPSAELRELQEAILQQRADLTPPARIATTPAVQSRSHAVPRTLPPRLTSFLGRETELRRVAALLQAHRLVTITGPGGVGKTSLALEAARTVADGFPDGVGLVRLAGVTDPAQVPQAVLTALQVRDVATATAEDQLLGHLRDRAALLVLDNCEHLADACALLAERLLESCSGCGCWRPAVNRSPLAARSRALSIRYPCPPGTRCPPTWRSTPPSSSSSTAPAARCPTSTSARTTPSRSRSPRSAGTSTASRWRWNWPPRGWRRSPSRSWPTGWATASPC